MFEHLIILTGKQYDPPLASRRARMEIAGGEGTLNARVKKGVDDGWA